MKNRIIYIIMAFLAIVGNANAQTLSVASIEAKPGDQAELVVSASGMSNVTALQFNLALPQGVTLNENAITKGSAVSDHELVVETMANGERLFVLYKMDLGQISNGTLLKLPITIGQQSGTFSGSLNAIRTATTDAVSHDCANATFNVTVGTTVQPKVTTVQDKANAKQFVAKYVNNSTQPVYIDANDAKVYSIFVDGDATYFSACRTTDNKYIIQPQYTIEPGAGPNGTDLVVGDPGFGSHVIIKTEKAKEVTIHRMVLNEIYAGIYKRDCIAYDNVYDSQKDDDLALVLQNAIEANDGDGSYLYRLTNTSGIGFGFTSFTGSTIKEGQFFIACNKNPAGAGRLTTVWLDKDGNIESTDGELTGIESVESIDVNNGAVYTLQGVRIDSPAKGRLYIQNGKKIIMK